MSTEEHIFHLFPNLPAELREEIWRLCIPQQVCELNEPDAFWVWRNCPSSEVDEGDMWPCSVVESARINGMPPVITRVCHESRNVALKTGGVRKPDTFRGLAWKSTDQRAWEDQGDSVHLDPDPDPSSRTTNQNEDTIRFLTLIKTRWRSTVSMMLGNVFELGAIFDYEAKEPELSPWKQPVDFLVVMRTVIIHSDWESAVQTGLFGLLGDAPLQLVEATEEDKVEAMLNLAETCERDSSALLCQDFRRVSVEELVERLQRALQLTLVPEEIRTVMRPAIMFRLCTKKCNHDPDERTKAYIHRRYDEHWDGIELFRGSLRMIHPGELSWVFGQPQFAARSTGPCAGDKCSHDSCSRPSPAVARSIGSGTGETDSESA